jgi:hypothetical protein
MVTVHALEQTEGLLDHAPIFNHRLKFELGWLYQEGFHDMAKTVWDRLIGVGSPIQRWNNKQRYTTTLVVGHNM